MNKKRPLRSISPCGPGSSSKGSSWQFLLLTPDKTGRLTWDHTYCWCKRVQPHLLCRILHNYTAVTLALCQSTLWKKRFSRHYTSLKKQTHGIYILHFVFNISCKLFLALWGSISEHILKNYFLYLAWLGVYQYKTISMVLACYALTANTIKSVTRDSLHEDYLLLPMVAEKVLIWAEWAEGQKAVLVFTAAFTHYLSQKALSFLPDLAVHMPQFYQESVSKTETQRF